MTKKTSEKIFKIFDLKEKNRGKKLDSVTKQLVEYQDYRKGASKIEEIS